MTLPQRISDFLAQRRSRMYCDACVQERLGLKWRQQVQLITATLAVTPAFKRECNKCCMCEETKQVTYAVDGLFQATEAGSLPMGPRRKGPAGLSSQYDAVRVRS